MKPRIELLTIALSVFAIVNLSAQENVRSQKEKDYYATYAERDSTKTLAAGEAFLKKYPQTDPVADQKIGVNYGRIYYNMITGKKSEIDININRFYKELPYSTVAELYYRQVQLLGQYNLAPLEILVPRSRLLMAKIKSFQNNKPAEFTNMSAEDWTKTYEGLYYRSALIHVFLLTKNKDLKEGMEYANQLLSHFGYTITSFNEDYVELLSLSGDKIKTEKALIASVNANQASPKMLAMLKEFYLVENKDANGFDAYVESIKSAEGKVALERELKASMVKKEIPEFKVLDVNGKVVNSKDMKGKIIILDFWSSWCTPCKASFPGMQMAQNKLADQEDVVFYYIDCQERATDYKNTVVKYIKDNNYNFNLLFDTEGDKGINNAVCKLLNVTAIPRKMILDKSGIVRFDMDSYYGSPTKLADEIKIMVNLIQQEQ